jgi:hypothetical protein
LDFLISVELFGFLQGKFQRSGGLSRASIVMEDKQRELKIVG